MTDNKKVTVSLGSFPSWLTLLFIGLKLTHYIDWSWWWVFSPMLISFGLTLFILITILTIKIFICK